MTVHLSDPRPGFCSACHNSPQGRYVDMDAVHDGGNFVDRETQAYIEGTDDLHLCEDCVRRAAEVLAFKPDLDARQFREIQRLELRIEYWRQRAEEATRALDRAVQGMPPDVPQPVKRGPGRPRKVAA